MNLSLVKTAEIQPISGRKTEAGDRCSTLSTARHQPAATACAVELHAGGAGGLICTGGLLRLEGEIRGALTVVRVWRVLCAVLAIVVADGDRQEPRPHGVQNARA